MITNSGNISWKFPKSSPSEARNHPLPSCASMVWVQNEFSFYCNPVGILISRNNNDDNVRPINGCVVRTQQTGHTQDGAGHFVVPIPTDGPLAYANTEIIFEELLCNNV